MHPTLFYLPGVRLSQPELSSARLDGLLVEVGEGYMPADTPEGASARAAAIAPLLRTGLAASGPSAAWIHGAGDAAPARHHAHRASARRVRAPSGSRVVFHDGAVPEDDLMHIAGVAVTTPLRTMLDLVLGCTRHPEHEGWARALAEVWPPLVGEAVENLQSRRRVPGRRGAILLLDSLSRAESRTT